MAQKLIRKPDWNDIKGTVMQIEKALIGDRWRISKVSWKFRVPIIFNSVSIVFSVYKQNFTAQ